MMQHQAQEEDREFVSLDNLKQCEARFIAYMKEKEHRTFDSDVQVREIRKIIYTTMQSTFSELGPSVSAMTIRDFNNEVLNKTLTAVRNGQIHQQPEMDATLMHSRESSTFGIRHTNQPVRFSEPPSTNADLNSFFYQQKQMRDVAPQRPNVVMEPTKVEPISLDDFEKQDARLADSRLVDSQLADSRLATLIPRPSFKPDSPVFKHIVLNGTFRDIVADPYRFSFTTKMASQGSGHSLNDTYNNIYSIEVTRIVLPMEVTQTTGVVLAPKTSYHMEFSFSYPYVLLMVDDLEGVYDGNSSAVRGAFATLVYDRFYKGANGRGHIVLIPSNDDDALVFDPPLTSLKNISMKLLRPNGALYNASRDNYIAAHLSIDPAYPLFTRITLDKFYDRNEFWVGDTIHFSGLSLQLAPDTLGISQAQVADVEDFINRAEGHDVSQLAFTNSAGFVNAFYIFGHATFNTASGEIAIIPSFIAVIEAIAKGMVTIAKGPTIVNSSLQMTVTFKLKTSGTTRG